MNKDSPRPDFTKARRTLGAMQVGDWVLHPDIGVLRQGETEVRLTAKSLNVLLVLINAGESGEARDTLLDRVWGEHYPNDSVVSRAIADLRSAFGEKAGEQKYIRTLPKFGYQLVATVSALQADDRSMPAVPVRGPGLMITSFVIVVAAAIAWFTQVSNYESSPLAVLRLPLSRPLTSAPGLEHQPRFVPGGEWVVYSALRPGRIDWDLFRVSTSDGTSQPVAVTPGVQEHGPAVSPAGEEVAYVRITQEACDVVVQSLVLGVPEPIARCTRKFPTLVDWSPDGRQLVYTGSEEADEDGYRRLYAIDRASGKTRRLTDAVSPTGSDFYPRVSPDGRAVAFLRGEPQPDHRTTLWIVDMHSGEETRLTDQPAQLGGMVWLDAVTLIYGINDGGRIDGRMIDVVTNTVTPFERFDLVHPDYQRDGDVLVAAQMRSDRDLYLLDSGDRSRFLARSTSDDHHARFSNDEQWIVFISRRSGHDEIWIANTETQATRRLTRFDGATVRYPEWHPGGQRILFSAETEAGERLFVIDVVSGEMRQVDTSDKVATTARWLDDDRLVYGCRRDGSWGICVGNSAGGERIAEGYFRPTPIDAHTIAVVDEKGTLYRMDSSDGSTEMMWEGLPESGRFGWTVSGDHLIYATAGGEPSSPRLVQRNLVSGDSSIVFEGSMPLADTTISVGQRSGALLFTRHQTVSDDLVLFEGAFGGL